MQACLFIFTSTRTYIVCQKITVELVAIQRCSCLHWPHIEILLTFPSFLAPFYCPLTSLSHYPYYCHLYQDTWRCVVWPKKLARHTMSILTGRKKLQFSHICNSVISYLIETKLATKVPASKESLHTKLEEITSAHF